MTYASFNSELFQRFPQLKAASDKEITFSGDDGPYVVFGQLLVPEIDRAADADTDYFRRLLHFVEEIASVDTDGFNLVSIELGEPLSTLQHEELIRSAAGPHTLKAIAGAGLRSARIRLHLDRSPIASLARKVALALAGKKGKKC